MKTGAIGLCAGESCISVEFWDEFAAIMKGECMGILEQEMKRLAQQAGGSYKTVDDRIRLAQRFCERLVLAQNVQIRRVEQLKARHIEGYVRERVVQGITKRSCKMRWRRCAAF